MAFDNNSFSTDSFDVTSWLIDVVEAVKRFFRQIFVKTDDKELVITRSESDVWVNRKI